MGREKIDGHQARQRRPELGHAQARDQRDRTALRRHGLHQVEDAQCGHAAGDDAADEAQHDFRGEACREELHRGDGHVDDQQQAHDVGHAELRAGLHQHRVRAGIRGDIDRRQPAQLGDFSRMFAGEVGDVDRDRRIGEGRRRAYPQSDRDIGKASQRRMRRREGSARKGRLVFGLEFVADLGRAGDRRGHSRAPGRRTGRPSAIISATASLFEKLGPRSGHEPAEVSRGPAPCLVGTQPAVAAGAEGGVSMSRAYASPMP